MSGLTCRKPPAFYCRSPIACGTWGYCRERNFTVAGVPNEQTQAEWRALDTPAPVTEEGEA